ncbi:MAG: DUF349 domain-containing protein [Alphaproteobacteria bacterium]
MKSRDSSRGIFSPITAAWRWLWAPRKNPHAAEERENQRRREKRRRSSATAAATKTRVSTKPNTAPQTTELAYVDKSGNVRLTEGGRVVARANKGSKAAALADAKALYEQRAAELSALEAAINAPDALISELEGTIAQLKNDLRDTPGLGDLTVLETRFSALEAELEHRTQEQWNQKRDVIARMEALSSAAPGGLQVQIDALAAEWSQSGSAGTVHDTVLDRRYLAALEAATVRRKMAEEQPEVFAAERQAVLDELIDLMSSSQRQNMHSKLRELQLAWAKAGGPEEPELHQQFTQMAAAIEQDIQTFETETQDLRAEMEQEAASLEVTFDTLANDTDALSDGKTLRALSKTVTALETRTAGSNRDITDRLRRRIDELHWRADREVEKRRSQIGVLAQEARAHLQQAQQLPAQVSTLKEWRSVEDMAKTGMASAETALARLKELGRLASDEAGRISSELRDSRKAVNEARKAFFETLDESRETNNFRKRALLDRLSHPPTGASVKELDEHVDAVMAEWKQTGSAGREADQSLWAEFQDVRSGIRNLRDEASAAERDDFGARLAEAFTRKRELSYAIEDEIRMGRLVLENKKDPKFEKELRRKERRLEDLRKDLADIQRKLSKLSRNRSPELAEPKSAQPTDHAA